MASTEFSNSVLKDKFRGCMIGALVGDCLGRDFEIAVFLLAPNESIIKFLTNLMSKDSKELLPHTDDTRMSLSVAASLADKAEVNAKDMAERFTTDFFTQTIKKGYYGSHVKHVFYKLKESNYEHVFLPASNQFNGSGSFGNGAAMRIAPIALFAIGKETEFITSAVKECALITHYHPDGYNGAILQCLAVNAALKLDPSQELDPVNFASNLLEKMEQIETEEVKPYCEKLKIIKEFFLTNHEDISFEEIAKTLGNGHDMAALRSVPTAIYCFLKGTRPCKPSLLSKICYYIPTAVSSFLMRLFVKNHFECSNPFMRTVYFAISVGGDTDTIGSMASAIAGAYYGENLIPEIVQKQCEGIEEISSLADKLFDVTLLLNN